MYRYLSLYKLFVINQFKILMIYRADFIVGLICIILSFLTITFSIWAVFEQTNNIGGWNKYEVIFMYGYNLLAAGITWLFFNQAWGLRDALVSGRFIRYVVRPINPLFHYYAEAIDIKSAVTVVLGLTSLIYASRYIDFDWSGTAILIIGVFVLLSASLLSGLIVLSSSLGFWLTISNPLLGFIASMQGIAHIPMTIYGRAMTTLLSTIIPIAFLSYYPCAIILGKITYYDPIYLMLAVIVIIWTSAVTLWVKGVRRFALSGT